MSSAEYGEDGKGPVRIEGLKDLRKRLKKAGESYDDLKAAGLEAATVVADEARSVTVPYDSGTLAATIRPAGQAKGAVVRAGTSGVPYAGPIHFGWPDHNIAPQPFLYEAADARLDEVVDVYLRRVEEITDSIGDPA